MIATPEALVEEYLRRMAEIRGTGGATSETSYYGALETLLNAIGKTLKPRVVCNGQLRSQGAGHPDFGLYTQAQCRAGAPKEGQGEIPERGVVEVKRLAEPVLAIADTRQVSRYWQRYRLVLVTNYRDFLLVGVDARGQPVRLEGFTLADTDADFWDACTHPRRTARLKGASLIEYLRRALTHLAPLTRPSDLAWLLASYARDALARVDVVELPALQTVRSGLEEALGLRFEGPKGEHFFRSTLVQTLFYGVFSAWVQWCKEQPPGSTTRFDWHMAEWSLHVPMVRTLYEQIATPGQLRPLGLVEVLDWTGAALNRVERSAFFSAFDEGLAVQYFYEPFLASFDPEVRKQLGVWYTPPEVVKYMVARVDAVLESELGLAAGLADPNVYVLDPCCGTGSFLVETLRRIAERLRGQGEDALVAHDLKEAAINRVFGFEIMPAPFVIAHWQIGVLMKDAPFEEQERAAVYLTNALTGWQPAQGSKQRLLFREMEEERDAAEHVKREVPILVVIGNPPYNAFAGISPAEEEGLVEQYKAGLQAEWGIRKFNLDELYVRFLRIAERRIVEQSGRGVVCYISSYSYISDPSFVVVRQHLLDGFDSLWIDSLNGDSRETGKLTPAGEPDPSVFSTQFNREGIRLGTAVGLFVRSRGRTATPPVHYRDFWGARKREDLVASLGDAGFANSYIEANPTVVNRFSFRPQAVTTDYTSWPRLLDVGEVDPYSGVLEMRKGSLMSIDREPLEERMRRYLDPTLSFETVRASRSGPVQNAGRFNSEAARRRILAAEPFDRGRLVRYSMFPLDQRWVYHTNVRPVWNEPRPEFASQVRGRNLFIISRMMAERPREGVPVIVSRALADYHLLRPNVQAMPSRLFDNAGRQGELLDRVPSKRANLSARARDWLVAINWPDPDADAEAGAAPWLHMLAISYAPAWLVENRDGILADWPRVPLPVSAEALRASAGLGARLAALLDPDEEVAGVNSGTPEPPLAAFGAITRAGGGQLAPAELTITAGWGHGGAGRPVMPGQGKLTERHAYTADELAQIETAAAERGEATADLLARLGPPVDAWLNDVAYWRTVPRAVWEFRIGGYQVVKKWLSYREERVLGRSLTTGEAREVTGMVRRLAAIVLMQPELDANYLSTRENAYSWPSPASGPATRNQSARPMVG